jgi:caffeoyl-CoA O-methyltransferase
MPHRDIVNPDVEAYAEANTTPEPDYLQAATDRALRELGPRNISVGHLGATLLGILVAASNAKRVLEIGTFFGYSALAMAASLPADGTLITCEIDPRHAEVAAANTDASPYKERIQVITGPALDTIKGLSGEFDLAFIDADKSGYPAYYDAVLPRIRPGGLIVIDNTLRGGSVARTGDDPGTRLIRDLNARIAADERVDCVLLPVRDGMTVIRRRPLAE